MTGKIAKYELIKEEIRKSIERRELKPNQVILSEHELCEKYQVSRITVRKAIDELVHEELLYRIKGKGCFVRDTDQKGLASIYSFTEAINHQGKKSSKELLSVTRESCDAEMAEKMGLEASDEVYRIRSLYMADGEPYCVHVSILPEKRFPKLEYFDLEHNSLYEILQTFYQLSFTRVQQVLSAVQGSGELCERLHVGKSNPLLKINAVSYCLHENKETVFELYESYILTDILNYYVEKHNR